MTNRIARILGYLTGNQPNNWSSIEYFSKKWKNRIKKMSAHIDPNCSVIDLGCGPMWLKRYLPQSVTYYPVDYTYRGADCIVQDFNQYQYPGVNADTAFVSGCLEYINDPSWFVSEICRNQSKCILSYCTTEHFPGTAARKRKAWVNSLSEAQVINLFNEFGFDLKEKTNEQMYVIFVFGKRTQEQGIVHQ